MKVLTIIGSSGFLGKSIIDYAIKKKIDVLTDLAQAKSKESTELFEDGDLNNLALVQTVRLYQLLSKVSLVRLIQEGHLSHWLIWIHMMWKVIHPFTDI